MTTARRERTSWGGIACLLVIALLGVGEAPAAPAAKKLTPAELATRIDGHVAAGWKALKVTPAATAGDAEWVRRANLDLWGRIPDLPAVRDFLDDPAADKRARLIAALLKGDRYATHWAAVWRSSWLPEAREGRDSHVHAFEAWLRLQLRANRPYDRMARSVLGDDPAAANTGANSFYYAHEQKPEELASAASRLFLGVKIECAQCHDHPFAKWTRKQFWETAAFFGPAGAVTSPVTGKAVAARFLDGSAPKPGVPPREALADWVISRDNPYFARAAVNRVWEHLLGVGLVEPLGEEGEIQGNPSSHPELLVLLATQFAAHDFDLKYLIEAVMLSKPYHLSSRQTHASQADPSAFGRMRVRGLSPEQLFDSLVLAGGGKDDAAEYDARSLRAKFLRRFPNQGKRSEQQTSIPQALHLMNGKLVADATSLEHDTNLAAIAGAKTARTPRKVEQLFLVALSRKPTAAESARLVEYVDGGGPHKNPARALRDVFWALLESSEFSLNH
jgi:Protein of unknown function (DUF1549)/Protein of unknown function (DUF1553)